MYVHYVHVLDTFGGKIKQSAESDPEIDMDVILPNAIEAYINYWLLVINPWVAQIGLHTDIPCGY